MTTKNEKLKCARLSKRISQEGLAFLLNVSPTTFARWEAGQHEPGLMQLRMLCVYFDCPPEALGYEIYTPGAVEIS